MMRHGWLIVICIGFLSACAKEKEKVTGWASFPVSLYADAAMVAGPEGKSDFYAAMAFWESQAGRRLFDYKGEWSGGQPYQGSPGKPTSIQVNVILFQNPWPFESNTAGMTTIISSEENGFQGAVVMLNPSIPVCSGDCFGDWQRTSQQKLMAHELGHFIGLNHDASDPGNIMYPTLAPGGSLSASAVNRAALGQILH